MQNGNIQTGDRFCGFPIVGWVVFYRDRYGVDCQSFDTRVQAESFAAKRGSDVILPVTDC